MDEIINKVRITEEAIFDYESIAPNGAFPISDVKCLSEDYITIRKQENKLNYDKSFRIKYFDEEVDDFIMMFFIRGRNNESMQEYDLVGVCKESDWSEELEDVGLIRGWLKSKLDAKEDDWVLEYRVWKREQELAQNENMEDYINVVKELLKNYKLNIAKIKLAKMEARDTTKLETEMERLDNCISLIDNDDKEIIVDTYIKGMSLGRVSKKYGYTKSGVQYRRDKAINIIELLYSEAKK